MKPDAYFDRGGKGLCNVPGCERAIVDGGLCVPHGNLDAARTALEASAHLTAALTRLADGLAYLANDPNHRTSSS